MSVNELNVDYPEHLNPFRQRRNTLARSFRGIKKAIVRSFSSKDKDKPTIRPKPDVEAAPTRNVMSMPSNVEPQVLLPRSRFSERLNKTSSIGTALKCNLSFGIGENNPFEDGDESKLKYNTIDNIATAKSSEKKYRRRKEKAPVPPGSANGSINGSKWSLASSESEMSSLCCSEGEVDYVLKKTSYGKNEEILKITREIAKFAEDTNNNTICDEIQNKINYKTDICNLDLTKDDTSDINDQCNENINPVNAVNQHQDGYINATEVFPVINNSDQEDLKNDKITCKNSAISNDKFDSTLVSQLDESINGSHFVANDAKLVQPNCHYSSEETPETLEQVIHSVGSEKQGHEEDPQQIDNETVPDSMETRLSVKGTVDFFECMHASPTPKVRKNILTKEELLGSE